MYKERIDSCSNRISTALAIRRMRQADLCKSAKIPKSSLSLYLSGAYEPRQDRIYEMAKVLDVSEAWLMGYDVTMERKKEKKPPEEPRLTEGEKKLVDLFRLVPEDKQQLVLQMIEVALKTK